MFWFLFCVCLYVCVHEHLQACMSGYHVCVRPEEEVRAPGTRVRCLRAAMGVLETKQPGFFTTEPSLQPLVGFLLLGFCLKVRSASVARVDLRPVISPPHSPECWDRCVPTHLAGFLGLCFGLGNRNQHMLSTCTITEDRCLNFSM